MALWCQRCEQRCGSVLLWGKSDSDAEEFLVDDLKIKYAGNDVVDVDVCQQS